MKNELLFELNNVIVSLENNNRFSEANILNREFVKIAQNQQFLNELENEKFYTRYAIRMVSEFIFAIDDIVGSLNKLGGSSSLGVKDVDAYLPTMDEAVKIIQAQSAKGHSADEQETQSKVALNNAKVQESGSVTALNMKKAEDIEMDNYFEGLAAKRGKLSAVQID